MVNSHNNLEEKLWVPNGHSNDNTIIDAAGRPLTNRGHNSGSGLNASQITPPGTEDFLASLNNFQVRDLNLEGFSRSELNELQRLLTPKMTKYIPHVPTPKQAAFLLLDNKEAFYGGAAGGGKALAIDTPILTDAGWKLFGQLTVCDRVIAQDGTWSEIEYVTPVQEDHECYCIEFSNGEKIVADAQHLWTITEFKHRKHWETRTVTTTDLKVKDKLVDSKALKGKTQSLDIDPYVFGYWLGDGNSRTGSLTIGHDDIENIKPNLPPLTQYKSMETQYTVEGLTTQLTKLGILRPKHANRTTAPETKHIPVQFFLSSFDQRLVLLQGLMDSDGSIQERGRCEISLTEKRLADDLGTLLASLGIVYSRTMAPTIFDGKKCPSHRFTFSTTLQVFRLQRKAERIPLKVLNNRISIKAITRVNNQAVRCIRIKHQSHVFLVGKTLTPTHNSDALLMAGLQYVDVKGYAGIIFRKTYADLTKPGALIERAKEWLLPHNDVRWDEKNKRFEFQEKFGKRTETRSILQFGYLESPNDRYNYQGGEYQFVGFDELTHIDMHSYLYLFSRLRRLIGSTIPLRVRSASNPPDDDRGAWVKTRFIDEGVKKNRVFIPAGLDDNPYLDKEQYEESLQELDPVTRSRLRDGNWEIARKGNMFKRDWFQIVDVAPRSVRELRFWDMAASDPELQAKKKRSSDPDYTVGLLMSEHKGIFYIKDIIRVRKRPADTEIIQRHCAVTDGYSVIIREEQEPGSSGISTIDQKARTILLGYNYAGVRSTGSKATRAMSASAAAERGQIKIVRGCRFVDELFGELEQFPGGAHDDLVDALSGAYTALAEIPVFSIPLSVDNTDEGGSYWIDEAESGPGYYNNVRSLVRKGGM